MARLAAPMVALEPLRGLVVIDEVQRLPSLFEVLRVLADRPRTPARFLILGSADPRLVRGVSESLAWRVHHVDVTGFDLSEVGVERYRRLWLRGGLPRSFLARSDADSSTWRHDYIRDFLQRDLRELGVTIPSATLSRFWNMAAHFHGGVWNAAEFARSLGASENTARHYLDLLSGALAIRQLVPCRDLRHLDHLEHALDDLLRRHFFRLCLSSCPNSPVLLAPRARARRRSSPSSGFARAGKTAPAGAVTPARVG